MKAPIAYGIDFGTTNSLVSVVYPDSVEVLTVGGGPHPENLPSIVYLNREGIADAGDEAIRQYTQVGSATHPCGQCSIVEYNQKEFEGPCRFASLGGGCHDARLLSELKAFLADPDLDSTHSWGEDFMLEDLVAIILRRLKRAADRRIGADVTRAVIGHPIAYPGAEGARFRERQQTALERMKKAAAVAGFDEVVLYQEPAAAVLAEQGNGIMVAVDFGGGTFDVAILRMEPDRGRVLALQGVAVGGEDFDAAIFRSYIAPQLGVGSLPARYESQLTRLSEVLRLVGDPSTRDDLRYFARRDPRVGTLEAILYGGHSYQLFKEVERAKVDLSTHDRATVDFHRRGIDVAAAVDRAEFEQLIASDVDRVFEQIEAALDQAGVEPDDVDIVLRTGGSSAIPVFRTRLEGMFGPDRVQTRPAFSTIAKGLGEYARGVWQ